ncbi:MULTISPECIES: alpha/beta hydrolase [unclassified Devosia]|uniref:alpha/beta fold hydrolase n=1 Tax=unclassified Devosia TaxID=196773 RepID=UPI00145E0724|nr:MULTISPECIES: alpha/beta hydrolase [unclassified Devosia]MBJ6986644.1 alpha/beta hydrolase [Devosia sp. MC521]QMW61681.1 alpha/beta hydrolase [Devosia sp. MC521]
MTAEPFSIDIGGATIEGVEQGDGLPIIFLHAGVCDKRMWAEQMSAVADAGWHAIAYDRRGYGETTSTDEAFNHLDDLEALLDALDIHAALFVGCSMGGGLAIDFALAHPGRVLGLVLIGTSVTGAPWTATAEERAIEMAEEDAWDRGDLDMLNKVITHQWLDGPRAKSGRVGGDARALFMEMNGNILRKPELTGEIARPKAWDRTEDLTAPALLIVGDEDFTALVERHETLSETMPNAFAVVLEGVAHIPSVERPDLVNSLLLQFLDVLSGVDDEDEDEDAV